MMISVFGVEEGTRSFLIRLDNQDESFCFMFGVRKEEITELRFASERGGWEVAGMEFDWLERGGYEERGGGAGVVAARLLRSFSANDL